MPNPTLAALAAKLANPAQRLEAARNLATTIGAEDLIIFIMDPEIGQFLPAPGFPQTLPGGRAWPRFLAECATTGRHTGLLPFPNESTLLTATGVAAEDNSVLVLLGGLPVQDLVMEACTLVPLLAAAFKGEQAVNIAQGHLQLAQQSATQARLLVKALGTARHDLQVALQARDHFLSIAAHELKTPLTSLLGYLQLFKRRAVREAYMNARDQATLTTVELQAQRLHRMVNDLFDLSRIETGVFRIERRRLDLSLLCKKLLDEMEPVLDKHNLQFRTGGPTIIEGDYTRLEQVMQNLLDNAVKYSPDGGEILVEVKQRGGKACVSVGDRGIGIPEAAKSRLFERFYRASNADIRSIGGLGIGLYLVDKIVASHGGSVAISSQEGDGTTFTVCLPNSKDVSNLPLLSFSTPND